MSLLTYTVEEIEPIHNRILIKGMEIGERFTEGGIIIPSEDGKSQGIKPRWGEVCFIGPDQHDVEVGEYLLIEHGRWSRGFQMIIAGEEMTVRMIDETAILLVSDEPQREETESTAVVANSDRQRIEGSLHNDGTNRDAIAK